MPKFRIPDDGLEADAAAYQLILDELNLDGNPVLNLASFVTRWMEPQADALALETRAKNLIDQDEYPQTEAIHERVVSMIGGLFHAPSSSNAVGTATIGSSEAIMLGLLAHKRSWQHRRKAAGESTERPNMVMGADVHTCWEKFARYFEVEPRVVPMEDGRYTVAAEQVEPLHRRAHDRAWGACSARRSPATWTTCSRSTSCWSGSRPSAACASPCTSTRPPAAS